MPDKDYSCHVNYDGVPSETKADSMLLSPKKTCCSLSVSNQHLFHFLFLKRQFLCDRSEKTHIVLEVKETVQHFGKVTYSISC